MSETCEIEGCREPAVVGINGHHFCVRHIDEGMKRTLGPVKEAMRRLGMVLPEKEG